MKRPSVRFLFAIAALMTMFIALLGWLAFSPPARDINLGADRFGIRLVTAAHADRSDQRFGTSILQTASGPWQMAWADIGRLRVCFWALTRLESVQPSQFLPQRPETAYVEIRQWGKRTGFIPWTPNLTLSDAIAIAGGIAPANNSISIERLAKDPAPDLKFRKSDFVTDAKIQGLTFHPGDRVTIGRPFGRIVSTSMYFGRWENTKVIIPDRVPFEISQPASCFAGNPIHLHTPVALTIDRLDSFEQELLPSSAPSKQ